VTIAGPLSVRHHAVTNGSGLRQEVRKPTWMAAGRRDIGCGDRLCR